MSGPYDTSFKKKEKLIKDLLRKFFDGDEEMVHCWLNAKNLNLGGMSPNRLIALGRIDRVIDFIKTSKEENGW